MILSDHQIRDAIENGAITVEPYDPENVQPASIDIRLGNEFRRFTTTEPVNPLETDPREVTRFEGVDDGDTFQLQPGEFALATTYERLELPAEVLAQVVGRSSFGRWGVAVHITAGLADPGFEGPITLELKNVNQMPIDLPVGHPICQFVFTELAAACERPYGVERGSHYQNQPRAEPARIYEGGDE